MTTTPRRTGHARLALLARRSVEVIAEHQRPNGAYPASPTFSAYAGYVWLRDGGFTAEGMSRAGEPQSATRFHDWVTLVLTSRRGQVDRLMARHAAGESVPSADMLPTRFTFEGADGSDDWWDFQTDGYGTWIWSVVMHAQRHGLPIERWRTGIEVAVDFVTTFWDEPCYDWWEEHHEHRHISTLGAIVGGVEAALASSVLDSRREAAAIAVATAARALVLEQGVSENHLTKWIGTSAVDASLTSSIVPFGLFPVGSTIAAETVAQVRDRLDAGGGVHRFADDVFYGGGQWPLLTAFLGWNEAAAGDHESALAHLEWIADHATDTGELPEQVPDHLLHPQARQEWIDRWGPVATPLLWSHAMYLILADALDLTGAHR